MKTTKKITAIVLSAIMVLAMGVMAFAIGTNGEITITNAVEGQTYSIYQIFDLQSFDAEKNHYSYKIVDAWADFVATQTNFVTVDKDGFVEIVDGADEATAAAFANAAIAYAEENSIEATDSKEADSETVEFTGLSLGYYLVDSTAGTLCSLDTTNPTVEIEDKNPAPSVDKNIVEGETETKTNDVNIGDTVNYEITVTLQPGAENYVLHDVLSDGLTLNNDIVADIAAENYVVTTTELSDDCDFELAFTKAYLDTITEETTVTVTYSAVLNENAVTTADGNTNEVKLVYGEDNDLETDPVKTVTKTYEFDIVKTTSDAAVLDGATFELYDEANEKVALVDLGDGNYRVATADDETTTTTIAAGVANIYGVDAGSYYLKETQAPTGYNAIKDNIPVEVTANNNATVETVEEVETYKEGGIQVINKTGAELPSTGGIGTTIFYIVGALLVVGACIVLVVKRRMKTEA